MPPYLFWSPDRIEEARDALVEHGSYARAVVFLNLKWGTDITSEAIRKALYRNGYTGNGNGNGNGNGHTPPLRPTEENTASIDIVRAVQAGANDLERLCDRMGMPPGEVRKKVALAQEQGYDLKITDTHIQFAKQSEEVEPVSLGKISSGGELVFAAIGDTHCGSQEFAAAELAQFVEYAHGLGVRHIFHAGDIFDGCYHRGHHYELAYSGFERQCAVALDGFPQHPDLTYHTITGNHDINSYWKAVGMDPGLTFQQRAEAAGRKDIRHHGAQQARLVFGEGDDAFKIELFHPTKGAAYARSWPVQKYAESLEGGSKPDIAIVGHYHCYSVNEIRNICCIQPGCFQWQTPYLQSKHLEPAIGGVICRVSRRNGGWRFVHEWIQYWPQGKPWEVV